jgi:osmotically-inducible protein OsmY
MNRNPSAVDWKQPMDRSSVRWGVLTSTMLTGICLALAASGCTPSASAAPANSSESAGELLDDTVITTRVKAAFLNEPALKSFQIGVKTFKDTVQLSGFVDSHSTKLLAGRVASGVKGVAKVSNDLIVK